MKKILLLSCCLALAITSCEGPSEEKDNTIAETEEIEVNREEIIKMEKTSVELESTAEEIEKTAQELDSLVNNL